MYVYFDGREVEAVDFVNGSWNEFIYTGFSSQRDVDSSQRDWTMSQLDIESPAIALLRSAPKPTGVSIQRSRDSIFLLRDILWVVVFELLFADRIHQFV